MIAQLRELLFDRSALLCVCAREGQRRIAEVIWENYPAASVYAVMLMQQRSVVGADVAYPVVIVYESQLYFINPFPKRGSLSSGTLELPNDVVMLSRSGMISHAVDTYVKTIGWCCRQSQLLGSDDNKSILSIVPRPELGLQSV